MENDLSLLWHVALSASRIENDSLIADSLGISGAKFKKLQEDWPEFKAAYEAGRRIYNDNRPEWLDDDLIALWRKIRDSEGDSKQDLLLNLSTNGDWQLQRLLITALVENFDLNRCLRILKIPAKKFRTWMQKDLEFRELLEDVEFAKRNLAESRLMSLVSEGNVKAVLFANESLNRETYGKRMEYAVEHTHNHTIGLIDLSNIEIPLEVRTQLVKAIRQSGLTDPDGLLALEGITVDAELRH